MQPAARDAVPGAGAKRAGKESEDVSLGKKYFNAGNFTLAERHFRRAVELRPRDLDSWVGLAASYDRLRRFELADRAYVVNRGRIGMSGDAKTLAADPSIREAYMGLT